MPDSTALDLSSLTLQYKASQTNRLGEPSFVLNYVRCYSYQFKPPVSMQSCLIQVHLQLV